MGKFSIKRTTIISQHHYDLILEHANVISSSKKSNEFVFGCGFLGGEKKGSTYVVHAIFPVKKQYPKNIAYYHVEYFSTRNFFTSKNVRMLGLYSFKNTMRSERPFDRISNTGLPWLVELSIKDIKNPRFLSQVKVVESIDSFKNKSTSKCFDNHSSSYEQNFQRILRGKSVHYDIESPQEEISTFKIVL